MIYLAKMHFLCHKVVHKKHTRTVLTCWILFLFQNVQSVGSCRSSFFITSLTKTKAYDWANPNEFLSYNFLPSCTSLAILNVINSK